MFNHFSIMTATHLAYLGISIAVVVWVGRTLARHGEAFIALRYARRELATSLTHLLIMGFYLLHFGAVLMALSLGGDVTNTTAAIELLSTKIGFVLLALAVSHLTHVAYFSRIRPAKDNTTTAAVVAECAE